MRNLVVSIIYAFNTEPRDIAVEIAENLDPQSAEQALDDGAYVMSFLKRENQYFGSKHPRNPCDTLHLVQEVRTWQYPSGIDEKGLLYWASNGKGKCAPMAAEALEEMSQTE